MATTRRRTLARAFRTNRNGRQTEPGPVHGTARLGRRTKDLVKRLDSGDVAVIDHRNLDRIAADGVRCLPAALGDDSGIIGCAAYAKAHPAARAEVA